MGFDFAGTYTKIIEHRLIEYSFDDRLAQVVFTPRPTGVGVPTPLTQLSSSVVDGR
jgi:hypothetical protein